MARCSFPTEARTAARPIFSARCSFLTEVRTAAQFSQLAVPSLPKQERQPCSRFPYVHAWFSKTSVAISTFERYLYDGTNGSSTRSIWKSIWVENFIFRIPHSTHNGISFLILSLCDRLDPDEDLFSSTAQQIEPCTCDAIHCSMI